MSGPGFLILASVLLKVQRRVFDPATNLPLTARGYYRNFAVAARTEEEAMRMVGGAVSDGTVDWGDSEIRRLTCEEEASFGEGPNGRDGIWYSSGHVFFP